MNDGRGGLWPNLTPATPVCVGMIKTFGEVIARANAANTTPFPHRVNAYLDWATAASRELRQWLHSRDVDSIVWTPFYWHALADRTQSPVSQRHAEMELNEAIGRVANTDEDLNVFWQHWRGVTIVVPDTNVLMETDDPFDERDWHALAQIDTSSPLTVVLLQVVVDELDRQKDRGEQLPRRRARKALQRVEALLAGGPDDPVVLSGANAHSGVGEVRLRFIGENPRRERLPIPDDEIADRASQFWWFAHTQPTLVTNDTGMIVRCRQHKVRAVRATQLQP